MKSLLASLILVGALELVGCRQVDERELALRLDEIATLGSEAKAPGPRSPRQVAAIEAQVAAITSYVRRLAR